MSMLLVLLPGVKFEEKLLETAWKSSHNEKKEHARVALKKSWVQSFSCGEVWAAIGCKEISKCIDKIIK